MVMKKLNLWILCAVILIGCTKDEDPMIDNQTPTNADNSMYFPPIDGAWETVAASALGWDDNAIEPLKEFLIESNTKSFIILVNGRIVMEEYFNGHTAASTWQWNSAGKTLVTSMIGIAQQNQLLNIVDKASDFLGAAWTNMPLEIEDLIQIHHLLTMTSGIDDTKQLVSKQNLTYVADAGTRWAYGNVFQKLMDIVSASSDQSFEDYFDLQLADKIGMDGFWDNGLIYTIYHSTTRSMARFGLLALNQGKWDEEQVIDEAFFAESINSSQELNPAYGYMWWLNGKSEFMVPSSQVVYPGALVPSAPDDMFAAMGANEQRIYVIPSKNMVVIRMGEATNLDQANFAVSGFDNLLWDKINDVIN